MNKMTFEEQFQMYVQGGFPLVAVDTVEVDRATDTLLQCLATWEAEVLPTIDNVEEWIKQVGYERWVWNCRIGWHPPRKYDDAVRDTQHPEAALAHLLRSTDMAQASPNPRAVVGTPPNGLVESAGRGLQPRPGVFIMENFHLHIQDSYSNQLLIQYLRDVALVGRETSRHLFLVGDVTKYPREIQNQMIMIEFKLPGREELLAFVKEETQPRGMKLNRTQMADAADAMAGMTLHEAESALCAALVTSGGKGLSQQTLFEEKAKAVRRSGLLEHVASPVTFDSVGGLDRFKVGAQKVAKAFKDREAARKYKLPPPKGCLLVGIQGAGKSLSAKAIANEFNVQLFRCDIGRLFGGIVGDTERNQRQVVQLADAMAPCVVLIDSNESPIGVI